MRTSSYTWWRAYSWTYLNRWSKCPKMSKLTEKFPLSRTPCPDQCNTTRGSRRHWFVYYCELLYDDRWTHTTKGCQYQPLEKEVVGRRMRFDSITGRPQWRQPVGSTVHWRWASAGGHQVDLLVVHWHWDWTHSTTTLSDGANRSDQVDRQWWLAKFFLLYWPHPIEFGWDKFGIVGWDSIREGRPIPGSRWRTMPISIVFSHCKIGHRWQ